jgi:UDP-2-acetamido-3-amino-2,3-dideoxy-glucuronate N-acetyltransferase
MNHPDFTLDFYNTVRYPRRISNKFSVYEETKMTHENRSNPLVAPDVFIETGADIASSCVIGPGCQIGAGAVIKGSTRLGKRVRMVGKVKLGNYVLVGDDVLLIGPLNIAADTVIANEVTIGAVIAVGRSGQETRIGAKGRIGRKASVLGGLTLGEGAFVRSHCRLSGDAPPHALVEGDPAVLAGFLCPCGKRLNTPTAQIGQVQHFHCNQCDTTCILTISEQQRIGRMLLPGGSANERQDWLRVRWEWDDKEEMG